MQTFFSRSMPSPSRDESARRLLPRRVRASLRPRLRSSPDRVTRRLPQSDLTRLISGGPGAGRNNARSVHEAAPDKARATAKTEAHAISRRERKKVKMLLAYLKRSSGSIDCASVAQAVALSDSGRYGFGLWLP
jgi:hypothetical protein